MRDIQRQQTDQQRQNNQSVLSVACAAFDQHTVYQEISESFIDNDDVISYISAFTTSVTIFTVKFSSTVVSSISFRSKRKKICQLNSFLSHYSSDSYSFLNKRVYELNSQTMISIFYETQQENEDEILKWQWEMSILSFKHTQNTDNSEIQSQNTDISKNENEYLDIDDLWDFDTEWVDLSQ